MRSFLVSFLVGPLLALSIWPFAMAHSPTGTATPPPSATPAASPTEVSMPRPRNDNFPGERLSGLPAELEVSTAGATLEPGEPLLPNALGSVWYSFVASADGATGIELGSMDGAGGAVAVFKGDSLASLEEVAYGSPPSAGGFALTLRTTAGETYHVQVTSTAPSPGGGLYQMRILPGEPPANDVFPGRAILAVPFHMSIDTTFATVDPGEASTFGSTVWFEWRASAGTYVVDTIGSNFPAFLTVKDASLLDVPGGSRGTSTSCVGQALTVFEVAAGEQLWFQAGGQGFPGAVGQLVFNLRRLNPGDPPPCVPSDDEPPFDGVAAREIHVALHRRDLGDHGFVVREDSKGVVQIWFGNTSLLPVGRYSVSLNTRGVCDFSDSAASGDVLALLGAVEFEEPQPTKLREIAITTRAVSLFPGRDNSIYDMDGTSLVFRAADFLEDRAGTVRACAVLAPPVPGAPTVGSGLAAGGDNPAPRVVFTVAGLALAATGGLALTRHNRA